VFLVSGTVLNNARNQILLETDLLHALEV
jgi:hypothetical protein